MAGASDSRELILNKEKRGQISKEIQNAYLKQFLGVLHSLPCLLWSSRLVLTSTAISQSRRHSQYLQGNTLGPTAKSSLTALLSTLWRLHWSFCCYVTRTPFLLFIRTHPSLPPEPTPAVPRFLLRVFPRWFSQGSGRKTLKVWGSRGCHGKELTLGTGRHFRNAGVCPLDAYWLIKYRNSWGRGGIVKTG